MLTTLSSCALHAPGSFFFYPWKPLLQFALGDSYEDAYQSFRRDHSQGANIALHLVALAWTMLANYGLLYLVDRHLFPEVLTLGGILGTSSRALLNARFPPLPLSYLTAVVQIIVLMCSPAPIECSSLVTAFVGAAYIAGPLMTAHQLELGAAAAFGVMLVLVKLLRGSEVRVSQSVSQSVITTLLPAEHMVHIYTLGLTLTLTLTRCA